MFKILNKRISNHSFSEKRYFSFSGIREGIISGSFWNTISLTSEDKIRLVWDNHISKIKHLKFYLSSTGIQATFEGERGPMHLRWSISGGQPTFFELGMFNSMTRYDIHYPHEIKKCPELYQWLSENGIRYSDMYHQDANL